MYILTDGKNYVIRDELNPGRLMKSTYAAKAEKFTYKQARSLLQSKRAATKWIKNEKFYMVEEETEEKVIPKQMSNADIYVGKNDIEMDESILNGILDEVESVLSLKAWNKNQLITYSNLLNANLSKYDSAEQDVLHAIENYKFETGKNPQAHKMTKIYIMLEEIRANRRKIKQCINYINVFISAIDNNYTVEKLKMHLSRVVGGEYKGRTEYYKKVLEMLQ